MALKRYNRQLSERKPESMKPGTWALLQGAHARRASLLAGKGNAKKAKSIAKYLWKQKDAARSYDKPRIMGPSKPSTGSSKAGKPKRIRLGNPLRNIPKSFTQKSFG